MIDDRLKLRKITAGHYRNAAGHEAWRMATDDPSRVAGLPWRLVDGVTGSWMADYATLADAQASLSGAD